MHTGRFVFAELIAHLPHKEFQKCVTRYGGDRRDRSFSCWDQYLALAFAQFTYRESLRDIEACLGAMQGKLYHLGFRGKVARSTLADANETHDWRIFGDFAHYLISVARLLHADDPKTGSAQEFDKAPNWRGFQNLGFPAPVCGLAASACRRRGNPTGRTRPSVPKPRAACPTHRASLQTSGNVSFYEG
jgi:hypothetical protein